MYNKSVPNGTESGCVIIPSTLPKTIFLFRGLNHEERLRAERYLSPVTTYKKGDVIYNPHHFQKALGIVLSGEISVRPPQEQGRPLIIHRLGSGDVFGAAALFDETASDYVTDLVALSTVCVRYVSQEQMTALFSEFPTVAQNYITFLSGRIRFLNRKFSTLIGKTAVSRLYEYCLTHQTESGTITLPQKMTELARSLNMGRSSLYRALETLLSEDIVSKCGKEYTLSK